MDGDQRMKQHERLMARSGNGNRATDRFEPSHPRGDPTGMSQAERQMSYDYGYTGFPVSNLYGPEVRRARRREPFMPYESAMLYGFGQQGPAPGHFEAVPQYPPRQSAAIEALSSTFAVPQYFAPEDAPAGVQGLSPYLNPNLPYNQTGPMPRSSSSQPFPAMSDYSPIGQSGRLDPPLGQDDAPRQEHESQSVDEAFSQYQQALRGTFDHTRAGRLVDASRSLLEISEWLVTNARDLGKFGFFFFALFLSFPPCFDSYYLGSIAEIYHFAVRILELVKAGLFTVSREDTAYHHHTLDWTLIYFPHILLDFLKLCFFPSFFLQARVMQASSDNFDGLVGDRED